MPHTHVSSLRSETLDYSISVHGAKSLQTCLYLEAIQNMFIKLNIFNQCSLKNEVNLEGFG